MMDRLPEDCQRLIWRKVYDGVCDSMNKKVREFYSAKLDKVGDSMEYSYRQCLILVTKRGMCDCDQSNELSLEIGKYRAYDRKYTITKTLLWNAMMASF